ncbi:hypothetical protein CVT26_011050 [Gymnopilus dilepis]|uniref:Uncharacterized protein n=1 Tax=Gymnopilus dilepis TaxID=231916 RepID=A0A409VIV2_9AGAR|nr:hypothetical protein CVT26_011050 [Gymnopilus dilepis]
MSQCTSEESSPCLPGKIFAANAKNGWNTGSKPSNRGYEKYSGQLGSGKTYGYSQNAHYPEWSQRPQRPTSAFEIVHFTPVPRSATTSSHTEPTSPLPTSKFSTLTSTSSMSNSYSSSPTAFNLVPSTSLAAPSNTYPSPSPYDYGGIVGGSPPSPTASPSSPQSDLQTPMPLGVIVAIIIGALFVVVLVLAIYVLARPKLSKLAKSWKKPKSTSRRYQQRMASIGSFEAKEFQGRQSEFMAQDEDYSRPPSQSLLLSNSQATPSSRDRDTEGTILRSLPAAYKASPSYYSRWSRVASWRSLTSAPISVASRPPSGKHKSMTRIMSILEGYPFQHDISSTEGVGSRSQSPNWSTTDHDYYTRSIPIIVPTVE